MANNIYATTQPPLETYPGDATRNNANGTDQDVLERAKIREICEGWGLYRDAAEWTNYRSMFHDDAYIATSWHQGGIDDFIEASKKGFAMQDEGFMYILHRIIGQTVDVQGDRAVSKMKVTITCRYNFEGGLEKGGFEMDNEADCRFFFLLEKRKGRWGVVFYTLLFDKDKMVPVNAGRQYQIPEEEASKYPSGYRYLAWCEANISKTPPKMDLNSHGSERDVLYGKCKDWLDGKGVKPNLTGTDVVESW
ncbi:hypothetical protein LTR27_004702 [Elasticomyces elasticus]|nr:hypothetical protein LTR27_004702 [Elasticomyces elasticus]